MKFCLVLVGILFGASVQAGLMGEVEVDSRGRALHLTKKEAEKLCLEKGARLPSIHEYAMYSFQQGAKGVIASSYPGVVWNDPRVIQEENFYYQLGFRLIHGQNQQGRAVADFYYNGMGHASSGTGPQYGYFWSSTPVAPEIAPQRPDPAGSFVYSFYLGVYRPGGPIIGEIRRPGFSDYLYGVRCMF